MVGRSVLMEISRSAVVKQLLGIIGAWIKNKDNI